MTLTVSGLDEVIESFDKFVKHNNTAIRMSLNDTGRKARTASLKATREDWNVSAKDFKKASKLSLAKNSKLNLQFTMDSKSMPLHQFSAVYRSGYTPTGKQRSGGGGVYYKLKGKGRKPKLGGGSFIMKSKYNGGREEVFTRRKSPNGADITAQYSITPTSIFKQEGYDIFLDVFHENFADEYRRQVARLTK